MSKMMDFILSCIGDDIMKVMSAVLVGLGTLLGMMLSITPRKTLDNNGKDASGSTSMRLGCKASNPAKHDWEHFNLKYGTVWMGCFAIIIAFKLYESFDEFAYMAVLGGLCIPILAFPFFTTPHLSEVEMPLRRRFASRANLWMAIYSFVGNYWYTHYFYTVLKANFTFPSWRLNDVPIPLYFATFFYFSFYHSLGNVAIRKVVTSFNAGIARTVTLVVLVGAMAYTTAFMETLTISSFPYYTFEDRDMAYVLGSAFYGIYFIVSFPMFYAFDEWPKQENQEVTGNGAGLHGSVGEDRTLWGTAVNSMGASMLILTLLDLVRLVLGIEFVIKAT